MVILRVITIFDTSKIQWDKIEIPYIWLVGNFPICYFQQPHLYFWLPQPQLLRFLSIYLLIYLK